MKKILYVTWLSVLLLVGVPLLSDAYLGTMSVYEGFDLNTGTIERDPRALLVIIGNVERAAEILHFESAAGFEFSSHVDLLFGWQPSFEGKMTMTPFEAVQIALLKELPPTDASLKWLESLPFDTTPISMLDIDVNASMIIQTATHEYFEISKVRYDASTWSISFEYQRLEGKEIEVVPEPSTFILLGVGCLIMLRGILKRFRRGGGKGASGFLTHVFWISVLTTGFSMTQAVSDAQAVHYLAGNWNLQATGRTSNCTAGAPITCGPFTMSDPALTVQQDNYFSESLILTGQSGPRSLRGSTNAERIMFVIRGEGMTPISSPLAETRFDGTISGNTIAGTFFGYAAWTSGASSGRITWQGTFTVNVSPAPTPTPTLPPTPTPTVTPTLTPTPTLPPTPTLTVGPNTPTMTPFPPTPTPNVVGANLPCCAEHIGGLSTDEERTQKLYEHLTFEFDPPVTPAPTPEIDVAGSQYAIAGQEMTLTLTDNPQNSSGLLNGNVVNDTLCIQVGNLPNVSSPVCGEVQVVANNPVEISTGDYCDAFENLKMLETLLTEGPLSVLGKSPTGCKFESVFSSSSSGTPTPTPDPNEEECSLDWVPNFTVRPNSLCCPDSTDCIQDYASIEFNKEVTLIGVECSIPFLGIPYIASLNLDVGASLGLSGSFSVETDCDDGVLCGTLSIPVEIKAGISGNVLYVAKLSVYVVVTASGEMSACYTITTQKFCLSGQLCASGAFKGELKLGWFTVSLFSIETPQTCTNPPFEIPAGCGG